MLPEILIKKINFEIQEIDRLLEKAEPLLLLCQSKIPDFIELMALGSILHSFYNGIEILFIMIAREIDQKFPDGNKWHKKLLDQMKASQIRNQIISDESIKTLNEYLLFRHFFRHNYSFRLKWEEMKELVFDIQNVWNRLKKEIKKFIEIQN